MSTPADLIVNIRELVKTYPGKTPVEAVKGIDLSVTRGELFGLLGPNGAGKTTTISVCTTRALPTSGHVTIAGIDVVAHPAEARRFMGVVTQFNTLDRQCTVWENLYFHCRYFGLSHAHSSQKTAELLELFKLNERAKRFPANCPEVWHSAYRSLAPLRTSRWFSFLTNPAQAWTLRRVWHCGTSFAGFARRASRLF